MKLEKGIHQYDRTKKAISMILDSNGRTKSNVSDIFIFNLDKFC